jgi:Protein of unknown function (DUF3768)
MGQVKDRQLKLAELNDHFRRTGHGGEHYLTAGVHGMGSLFETIAIAAIGAFDTFTADNDPYGEHDFGVVHILGETVYWKIDYLSSDKQAGSPDPADPSRTCRVMTIMLAEDY